MNKFLNFNKDLISNRQKYWSITSYPYFAHLLFIFPAFLLSLVYYFGVADYEQGKWLKENYTAFTKIMRFITNYSNLVLYAFYLSILLHAYKNSLAQVNIEQAQQDALLVLKVIFWQIIVGLLVVSALKYSLGFSRPVLLGAAAAPWSFNYAYTSMPSGHTSEFFILALPLALYFRNKKIVYSLLCLTATSVAFSRLWLQAHYPEDVVAGLCLASLASFLILKNSKVK